MNLLNPEPGLFIWEVLIFFLFLFVLKRLTWKPLLAGLEERRKRISDSLVSVRQIQLQIEQWKNEQETIREELTHEISSMRKVAQEFRDTLLTEARKRAKEEFDKAMNDARLYCQRLQKEAISDIKTRTGRQVLRLVENIVRQELCIPNEQRNFLLLRIKDINFKVIPHSLGKVA